MKIILDTNFLIYCAKNKLDYIEKISDLVNENYELVVPEQVIKELEGLKNDRLRKVSGKDKSACDLALQLIKVNNIKVIHPKGKNTDEAVMSLDKENTKNITATLDREMRKILGRVILVSRGKKLILTK